MANDRRPMISPKGPKAGPPGPGRTELPDASEDQNGFNIVGVRLFDSPRVVYFLLSRGSVQPGTWVVVRARHGEEAGRVVIAPQQIVLAQISGEIEPIERVMSDEEILQMERFLNESPALVERAREIVRRCWPHVELRSARYSFDGSYVVISLAGSDGDEILGLEEALAEEFRVPVRIRNAGTRQPTRLMGGLGTFGRKPDTLSRENEHYRKIKEDLPRLGQRVRTHDGEGMVVALQVFRELVTVRYTDGGREMAHPVTDLLPERA
ncbi:MAG TPA: hypothetical protein VGR29_01220 [Thermomicrobiales bacterium]|nr:hypothetical protein [Thermomicrobiales bacterium]